MSNPLLWVIGGGGFVGSRLRSTLVQGYPNADIWDSTPPHFSWNNPVWLSQEISAAVAKFADAVRKKGCPWGLLWCAGTGVVQSRTEELESEWLAWMQLLNMLALHLLGGNREIPGSIFLASSAGGVYGGSSGEILTEQSLPTPISEYGKHKLRMEEALKKCAAEHSSLSCLIGRISSLYGPGQNLNKGQGLISHLSRCLIHRRPVNIYVSLDTRRDYLFIDDCAHNVAASFFRLMTQRPSLLIKIFACEELASLGRILGIFLGMTKQRPLIVAQRQRATNQSLSIKLRSDVWSDVNCRKTDLRTGIYLVHDHQLKLFRHGLLPPPATG